MHHDHDDELGWLWYPTPGAPSRLKIEPTPPPVPRLVLDTLADAEIEVDLSDQLRHFARPAIVDMSPFRSHDQAYWNETGRLVLEYLALQAGTRDVEPHRRGFIAWLRESPGGFEAYANGDDMARAALVDRFLQSMR